MTSLPEGRERRTSKLAMPEVGSYTPGIARIERTALQAINEHDALFKPLDPEEWQSHYSLLNHHVKVSNVMLKVGRYFGRSTRLVHVGGSAGLFHDTGKLDEMCKNYRRRRRLSSEEMAPVHLHPDFSSQFVRSLKSQVRKEDHPFLDDIELVAHYHHKGYHIKDSTLREIAYNVKAVDAFVSLQEDRERPGLGLKETHEALRMFDFVRTENDAFHLPYVALIEETFAVLRELYSTDV